MDINEGATDLKEKQTKYSSEKPNLVGDFKVKEYQYDQTEHVPVGNPELLATMRPSVKSLNNIKDDQD